MDTGKTRLHRLIVHRVGNRSREEGTSLSIRAADISGAVAETLIGRYLWGAQSSGTKYRFHHESDLDLNEVRAFAKKVFSDDTHFDDSSRAIAKHLYSKSTHTSVPEGDLFVVLFDVLGEDGGFSKVLGLFKSEIKDRFLVVDQHAETLSLEERTGIDPRNLQKAALIFEDGERVIAVERGSAATRYWIEDFLKVVPLADAKAAASLVAGVVKFAAAEINDSSSVIAFKAGLSEMVSSEEVVQVSDVLALTSKFLSKEQVSDVAAHIERDLECSIPVESTPDLRRLRQTLGAMLRTAPVAHGIDLHFSKGVRPSSVEVVPSDEDTSFDIKIKIQASK